MKFSIMFRVIVCSLVMYYVTPCFSTPTLVVLGDSLSAGYGLQKDESWVYLLTNKVAAQGIDVAIINASVSGATSADGLRALPKVLEKYNPQYLIVELGANDGLRGTPLLQMQNNLGQIITKAQAAQIKVLLIGIQLPPNYGKNYVDAFKNSFVDLSKKYSVPLVPFMFEGFALDPNYFQKDHLHPTAGAQALILNNVWTYLEPMLEK